MKTILIAHNYTEKSFSSMSYFLANHLASLGHNIIFISYRPYFKEPKIINNKNGKITVLSWPTKARPTTVKDAIWYAKVFLKYKPEIVLSHFAGSVITIGVSKILSFNNVKTFDYYHTLLSQIKIDLNNNWKIDFLVFRKKIFNKLFVNRIITGSEHGRLDLLKSFNWKKTDVAVYPISDRLNTLDNKIVPPNKISISFLGRLEPTKGVLALVIAYKKFKFINKNSRIVLNIAGTGSQESLIKDEAKDINEIKFIGELSYNMIDAFLYNTHYTIIPSKFDSFNVVGIESMMNKTPILLTNTTGLSHYLADDKDCYKFDASIESIITVLERVENNFSDYERMAGNARKSYLDQFTMQKYCLKMESILLNGY